MNTPILLRIDNHYFSLLRRSSSIVITTRETNRILSILSTALIYHYLCFLLQEKHHQLVDHHHTVSRRVLSLRLEALQNAQSMHGHIPEDIKTVLHYIHTSTTSRPHARCGPERSFGLCAIVLQRTRSTPSLEYLYR